MFNKFISKTYNNLPQILIFMAFNQTFIYGDFRGYILLLGLFINYIFNLILNKTTNVISGEKESNMPSINAQAMFFYIGFHIAHMISRSAVELSYTRIIYFIILGAMALFISSIINIEDLQIGEDGPSRILGALIGFIIGAFYFVLISYKYNPKGIDKYNKKYNVCKGGNRYKCGIDDYNKIMLTAKEEVENKTEEEYSNAEKDKGALSDAWKYDCDTCSDNIKI